MTYSKRENGRGCRVVSGGLHPRLRSGGLPGLIPDWFMRPGGAWWGRKFICLGLRGLRKVSDGIPMRLAAGRPWVGINHHDTIET